MLYPLSCDLLFCKVCGAAYAPVLSFQVYLLYTLNPYTLNLCPDRLIVVAGRPRNKHRHLGLLQPFGRKCARLAQDIPSRPTCVCVSKSDCIGIGVSLLLFWFARLCRRIVTVSFAVGVIVVTCVLARSFKPLSFGSPLTLTFNSFP